MALATAGHRPLRLAEVDVPPIRVRPGASRPDPWRSVVNGVLLVGSRGPEQHRSSI